jgi:hypothetical protein
VDQFQVQESTLQQVQNSGVAGADVKSLFSAAPFDESEKIVSSPPS